METEGIFMTFACILLFFDLIQLLKTKPRERRRLEHGFYASTLACGLIIASYLMLTQAFLTDNFRLKEVYSYSSSGLPALYKIFATWAGIGGSMLFLTFLMTIVYIAYRFMTYEKRRTFYVAVYKIMDFILIFFLLASLMNSPFQRLNEKPMDGAGLNPLLQTFWMFIHPPVVFTGYVFVIFAFALTLASMSIKKTITEDRTFRVSLQAAWLFLTLGIAIGGLWAYEVLGWGGYWAWDPVETSSLLPWLSLTAYFHLGLSAKGRKSLSKELMILLTFSAVMFTTALTRGGLLVSVHAFGLSPIGPVFLLFVLFMAVYFFYLKQKTKKQLFALELKPSSLYSISLGIGYFSLLFIMLVCFWGVTFPLIAGALQNRTLSTNMEFYNNWSFPFTLAFVAALIGCNIHDKLNMRQYVMLIAATLFVGVVSAWIRQPAPNFLANLGLPLFSVALLIIGYKLVASLLQKKRSLRHFGRTLLHLGVIVILIGVFISSTLKQTSGNILTKPGTKIDTLGLRLELKNFTVYTGTGNVHLGTRCYPEYSAIKIDVEIKQGSNVYRGAFWIYLYTAYGIVSKPLIISTLEGDIYAHAYHTNSTYNTLVHALMNMRVMPKDLIIIVEKIPFVHLVWIGVAMLSIGMGASLIREIVETFHKRQKTKSSIN
jgi:cytochrome c-type biogenesis protein CcmF